MLSQSFPLMTSRLHPAGLRSFSLQRHESWPSFLTKAVAIPKKPLEAARAQSVEPVFPSLDTMGLRLFARDNPSEALGGLPLSIRESLEKALDKIAQDPRSDASALDDLYIRHQQSETGPSEYPNKPGPVLEQSWGAIKSQLSLSPATSPCPNEAAAAYETSVAPSLGPSGILTPRPATKFLRRMRAYAQGIEWQLWWSIGPPVRNVWRNYRDELSKAQQQGLLPAVVEPRTFFIHLRLLGLRGLIGPSANWVAADDVVIREARSLFSRHIRADARATLAFDDFLERAVLYNPGKRRTKLRSMLIYYLRSSSLLPVEELPAYYDSLARDDSALADARGRQDRVMQDFKAVVDRLILETNQGDPPGGRVLGVLVFGSYANKAARPGSDIDMQIITEDGSAPTQKEGILKHLREEWAKLGTGINLDIISFTYLPPDQGLLVRIHPEPVLILSPYPQVTQGLSRRAPAKSVELEHRIGPVGRLGRGLFNSWLHALLATADAFDAMRARVRTAAEDLRNTLKSSTQRINSLDFTVGYVKGLESLGPGMPHTIRDIRLYIQESVPPEVAAAKDRPDVRYFIVEGDASESRKKLEADGWTLGGAVPRDVGFRQFYYARTPRGDPAFVALHVNGRDRVLHMQSIFKLLGVPGERVYTLSGLRSWKKEYLDTFQALGYVPDGVVYGLPWTAIHAVLARDPTLDFKSEEMRDFRRNFDPKPEGMPKNDIAFRPMKILELADGRRFWVFMHLYGEPVADLMAALLEHGVRDITVLGSAGSLDPRSRVGDWFTADSFIGPDGKNRALSEIKEIAGISRDGAMAHVPSPNVETLDWLHKTRKSGGKFVEVELKYILEQAAEYPDVRLHLAHIVSDVLDGPNHQDLSELPVEKIPGMTETVARIVAETLDLPVTRSLKVKSVKNLPFMVGR